MPVTMRTAIEQALQLTVQGTTQMPLWHTIATPTAPALFARLAGAAHVRVQIPPQVSAVHSHVLGSCKQSTSRLWHMAYICMSSNQPR